MPVYAILIRSEDGVELLPNYFKTYENALDKVKKMYRDVWDDRLDEDGTVNIYSNNKVEVGEGHKMPHVNPQDPALHDPNLTELYIERGNHISIHKLVKKPTRASRASAAPAAGGYSRRRQSKRNTKNSRKHRI